MTQAFDINTSLHNAVQYISQIFLTSNGNTDGRMGIALNGEAGSAWFL